MNSFIPKKTNDGKKKIELHSSEIFDSKDKRLCFSHFNVNRLLILNIFGGHPQNHQTERFLNFKGLRVLRLIKCHEQD